MLLKFGNGKKNNPKALSGLQLWYDSNQLNLANGVSVSSFTDLSGNGYNATQATPANQPVFRSSEPNMGYKPCLQFSGAQSLSIAGGALGILNNATGCSAFASVWCTTTATVGTILWISANLSNVVRFSLRKSAANLSNLQCRRLDADSNVNATGTTNISNNLFIITGISDCIAPTTTIVGNSSSNPGAEQIRLYVDNIEEDWDSYTASGNYSATNSAAIRIGETPTATNYFTGYLGELIVYNRALSPQESTTIFNYLKGKWNS